MDKQEPVDWEAVAADQAMTIAMMKLEKRDSSSWVDCTDEQLMEEVRRRGFVIRDAQIRATLTEPFTEEQKMFAYKKKWVGLTKKEFEQAVDGLEDLEDCWVQIEARLKEKNVPQP